MPLEAVDTAAGRRRQGLPLDAQLRPAASRPRTPRCASCSRSTARRSSRPFPTSAICTRGFEKLGEDLDFNQYVTIIDRMNYISPIANKIAWHHAVEKLLGIELTPRCKYIRTILAELARISDHLLCVGAAALDLGGVHGLPVRLLSARSDLRHLRDAVGPALSPSYTRVGGLMYDVDADCHRQGPRLSSRTSPRRTPTWCRLLNRNRIFIDRTQGHRRAVARKTRSTCSCTGPIARASGVVRDLRKDEPYLAYNDFDLQGRLRDGRRLLRPLPGAHGRDAARA